MRTILSFIIFFFIFQKDTSQIINGRVVSCTENKKSFYIKVQLDNKKEKVSTLIFTDKNDVADLISFVEINDSIFQVLNTGYIDVIKYSKQGEKIIKRFKLPEPLKPQIQKIIR